MTYSKKAMIFTIHFSPWIISNLFIYTFFKVVKGKGKKNGKVGHWWWVRQVLIAMQQDLIDVFFITIY